MVESTVALYLLSAKGLAVLESLSESEYRKHIAYVVVGRDPAVIDDHSEEIVQLAKFSGIPVFERLNKNIPPSKFSICAGWRWLLDEISKTIVLHDSLLPKYRGFAPLVTALVNGDEKIGVTAILSEATYDTGPILAQIEIPVPETIKIQTAIEKISDAYAKISLEVMAAIVSDQLEGIKQNEAEATYSLWLDDDDYWINWQKDAYAIQRFVNAVGHPYKGARTNIGNLTYVVKEVQVVPDVTICNRAPGKVIFRDALGMPTVVCGTGLIKIKELIEVESGESALPLGKFRTKFHTLNSVPGIDFGGETLT